MKIESSINGANWIIKIDGFKHLDINVLECVATHSYINSEFCNPLYGDINLPEFQPKYITRWFIEFYLKSGQTIKTEYDTVEKWKSVLEKL